MSWELFGPVSEQNDYRSPAIELKVAEHAEQGVVIYGPSRSGKTTLLRRLREHQALGPSSGSVDLAAGPDATLESLKKLPESCGVTLDETQRILLWPGEAHREVRKALEGRPYAIAAWPSLFQSALPDTLEWLSDIRQIPLTPMGLEETAHMVRSTKSGSPRQANDETVNAIFRATAGYPNLVARLCAYLTEDGSTLRAPTDDDLRGFIEAVSINNDPFRAIFDSLPRRLQQILDQSRSGARVRLEPLRASGIATGNNPATFSATLFEMVWSPQSDGSSSSTTFVIEPPESPAPVLSWIHLSDLHFGAGPRSHRFNQAVVTAAIAADLAKFPWTPDYIFVTGDIAFSAQKDQYAAATTWFQKILSERNWSADRFRFVPGNHDVDRDLVDANVDAVHEAIRKTPSKLDDHVGQKKLAKTLSNKLRQYSAFVKTVCPEHPKELDWGFAVEENGARGPLYVAGLSTVWVSDKHDQERKMIVGESQLRTLSDATENHLLLVLTHHPPGWLHPMTEELLLDRLSHLAPHIHFCGHVHSAAARVLKGLGVPRTSIRFVAGAAHGESTETHAYSWGAIRWHRQRWELGWAPRVFEPSLGVRANKNRYDLEDDDFAWESVELSWKPRT